MKTKFKLATVLCALALLPFGEAGKVFCQAISINQTGNAPDASSILDITSITSGFLIPKLTDAQRAVIPSVSQGLLIYNTTTNLFNVYNTSSPAGWYELGSITADGNTIGVTIPGAGIAFNENGATPDASAICDISSTVKGLLIPRTTTGSVGNVTGMIFYNTTTNVLNYFNGTAWVPLCGQFVNNTTGGVGTQGGAGIGISANSALPDDCAMLDISSTNKGLLIPRMTSTNRNSLNPAIGLALYNTTNNIPNYWNGTNWYSLTSSGPAQPSVITGTTPVCQSQTGVAYSVTNVSGVTYAWTYSGTGFSCATGCTTNSITADFSATATAGTLTVTPSNACGNGSTRTFAITLNLLPSSPAAGIQIPSATQINWDWNTVGGATGYKYNNANDYSTATDNGTSTSYSQTGLDCGTAYSLYVWAYNGCGNSSATTLNATTICDFCLSSASTTWTVPNNWNNANNIIEVLGPGGDGAAGVAATRGGGGGGGGAYASISNVTLTPGSTISIQVAAGGSGLSTWLKDNSATIIVQAAPGANGSAATGGIGGATAGCIGTIKFAGGKGGNNGTTTGGGGGGGGCGGAAGAGKNGGTAQAGSGGGGGGGCNGGSSTAGSNSTTSTGGNGGNGPLGTGSGAGGTTGNGSDATNISGAGGGGGAGGVAAATPSIGGQGAFRYSFSTNCGGSGGGGGGGGGGTTANAGSALNFQGGFGSSGYGGGGGGGGYSSNNGGTGGQGMNGRISISFTP